MSEEQGARLYPRRVKRVEKQRGLSLLAHGIHFWLGLLTCGVWWVVWFCWWLFRLIVPRRKTTTIYYEE